MAHGATMTALLGELSLSTNKTERGGTSWTGKSGIHTKFGHLAANSSRKRWKVCIEALSVKRMSCDMAEANDDETSCQRERAPCPFWISYCTDCDSGIKDFRHTSLHKTGFGTRSLVRHWERVYKASGRHFFHRIQAY